MICWGLLSVSLMAAMCVVADFLPKKMQKLINSISAGQQDSSTVVIRITNIDMSLYVLKLFKISTKLFAGVRKLVVTEVFSYKRCIFQIVGLIVEFVIIYIQFNVETLVK